MTKEKEFIGFLINLKEKCLEVYMFELMNKYLIQKLIKVIEEYYDISIKQKSDDEDQVEDQIEDQIDEKIEVYIGDQVETQIEAQIQNQAIITKTQRSTRTRKPVDILEANTNNKIYFNNGIIPFQFTS